MIGPAWSERGALAAGLLHEAQSGEWLLAQLRDIQLGVAAGLVETRATFEEAAAEYLRYAEEDRGCKPSTIRSYRYAIHAHLMTVFGKDGSRTSPLRTSRLALWSDLGRNRAGV